ncbi:MAG: response regulator [SAR324 cluster bacterium]|uniref:Response regulator n=1 Tax=SAR324 cluster bacterium TaxID=2024889 RepID=A0A2A4TB57_9DELT|nr:MAG: response regulator [SAR324 cluster bacterium]
MKFLIVDDNLQNSKLLQGMLHIYGESDIVLSGPEGIKAFQTAHQANNIYTIIFLDIMMPELDGLEVLALLRQFEEENHITKPVQVVMATSRSDTETILTSYEEGCQHYFLKPYDKLDLKELMALMGYYIG